jgi:predicted DNA-binding transcriptional regulator AlpA
VEHPILIENDPIPPEEPDFELAGRIVRWETEAFFPSLSALARAIEVDRSTIYKVFKGDPSVKTPTLRKLERALNWPRESIDAIIRHDMAWLRENGFPAPALRKVDLATKTVHTGEPGC